MTAFEYTKQHESVVRKINEVCRELEEVEEDGVKCRTERDDWKQMFDVEKKFRAEADIKQRDALIQIGQMKASFEDKLTELKDAYDQEKKIMCEELTNLKKIYLECQDSIKDLQTEKEALLNTAATVRSDMCVELDKCRERETMLLQYPDVQRPTQQFRIRGNPLQDMEGQLHANQLRVKLLEEQNCRLQNTIRKLKQLPGKSP